MTIRRAIGSVGAFALACVTVLGLQAQRQGAPGQAQGQLGGTGGGRGDGGAVPVVGQGALITGAWGAAPVPLDARGWGWMTQSYVSTGSKRPFWNKAKELLFSGKQVTSYTVSTFDSDLYCEVRKHYGFVWFEIGSTDKSLMSKVLKFAEDACQHGFELHRGKYRPLVAS